MADTECSCLEVYGEDPSCALHGIGTDWWAEEIAHNPLARAEIVETLRQHGQRVSELLAANNREVERRREAEAECERLRALINSPQTDDWLSAVNTEAAHQIERWGTDHDAGKTPLDWFWLLGYLEQKAAESAMRGDVEKAKHHTISSGAALLNWWRQISGISSLMRPGIAPPDTPVDGSIGMATGENG